MEFVKDLAETGLPPAIWAFMLYWLARHVLKRFQSPLEQVAQRLKRLGPAEFETTPTQSHEPARELTTSSPPATVEGDNGSLLGEFRSNILKSLQGVPEDRRQNELITELARWQIGWWLEAVNSLVLGSQIALLQELNSGPTPIARAREIYDQAVAAAPDYYSTYSFEGWLSWLRDTAQLVEQPTQEHLAIAELGRELLKYLIHRGYSFSRAG